VKNWDKEVEWLLLVCGLFVDAPVPTLYIIVGPCRLVVNRPGRDGSDGVVDPVGFNVVYQTLKWCCLQLSEKPKGRLDALCRQEE
jgi:hypothetical protein